MKKLAKHEADKIPLLKQGRKTALRGLLLTLEIGEAIMMKNEEWKAKRLPYEIATRLMKSSTLRFEYGRLPDESGWLFRRVG